jgi:DNA helicase-2/ATP-dependent DNA helicase PcrA
MAEHQHICLPNGITRSLQNGNTDIGLKRKFQKALEGLRVRPYPHSLYVKKLHSIGEFILEARLDQSQRLLFDYTSRYCGICKKNVPYVRILEYVSDHDDVTRSAKRLNREIDDAKLEDWDHLSLEEIVSQSDEPGLEYYEEMIDCYEEKIENSVQWYVFNDQEFDRLISQKNRDLRLLLTKEQATYLREAGPVIINGSTGSGKTTLGIYFLLNAVTTYPGLKALYVTYNNSLLTYSKNLFLSLCSDVFLSEELGEPGVLFSTFRQICCDIAKEQSFDEHNEETYLRFKHWFQRFPLYRNLDPAWVWIEIRSVLRGSVVTEGQINNENLNSEMISGEEYRDFGKKGTVFAYESDDFKSLIYDVGKRYQSHLEEENRYDEMSLTRAALRNLKGPLYDILVVDEVQDLTELQIELLLRLIPKGITYKLRVLLGCQGHFSAYFG